MCSTPKMPAAQATVKEEVAAPTILTVGTVGVRWWSSG